MRPSAIPRLDGDRVILTGFQREHLRCHFRWNNDPQLHALDSEAGFVPETFGRFARRFEAMAAGRLPSEQDFEIHRRRADGSELIGVGFLSGIDAASRRASVGVTICEPEARGQGYGQAALGLLLGHAFGSLGLHRVVAEAFTYHEPWRRLLQRTGFQREARLRDHLYRQGRFWDKEMYGLLAAEHAAGALRPAA